jgi:N-methylhydantoinase B
MATILEKGEASTRQALATLPDGEYSFEDCLDDWGQGTAPVKIKVTARVGGGEIILDFTGSDPQTESGLNSYINYTRAYGICAVRCIAIPSIPHNEGVARPIKFIVPEGSFFNPKPPAGGSSRATINVRIYDVVMGALSKAAPDRVMAGLSHWSNPNISGIDRSSGKNFIFYDLVMGGTGARPSKDGIEAMSAPFNAANIPVEVQEANTPLLVERIELIPDSGGPGKYRGGLGLRKDIRVSGAQLRLVNLTDRCTHAPFGLFGGGSGKVGQTIVTGEGTETAVHSKSTTRLADGNVISCQVSGGGGYGNPRERDAEAVRQDVLKGYVSIDAARRDYGVVIEPETHAVDNVATAAARAGMPV